MRTRTAHALVRPTSGLTCASLLALLLGGCTGSLLQSDAEAPDTFRLGVAAATDAVTTVATPSPSALAIAVARPRAAAAIDTDRIAVHSAGNRFDYYSAARWAESAPQMLQQNLVSALAATTQFGGVMTAPARVPTELLLDVELRRFEAVTTGADAAASGAAPVVHVQVQASLIDSRRAARVTSFISEAAVPASENRMSAVVAAFDRANAQVVSDIAARVQAATAALPAKP